MLMFVCFDARFRIQTRVEVGFDYVVCAELEEDYTINTPPISPGEEGLAAEAEVEGFTRGVRGRDGTGKGAKAGR